MRAQEEGVNLCSDPAEPSSHTHAHTDEQNKKSLNPLFCYLKGKKKAEGFKGVILGFLFFPIGKSSAFAPEENPR